MKTIVKLFETAVGQFSSNTLMWEKTAGNYQGISYHELHEAVLEMACGLIDLGIEPGDKLCLVGDGSSQWLVSELAALYCGAVVVPVSVKITGDAELSFRIEHSDSKYLVVSANHLKKISKTIHKASQLKSVIVLGNGSKNGKNVIPYSQIKEKGRQLKKSLSEELKSRMEAISEDGLATISYTSGTTSDPKGIMLTHRNYTANVEQANSLFHVPECYTTLLILPWDHSFAHTVGLYVMIKNGASIGVVEQGRNVFETLRNVPKNIKEIKPTFLLSVPALARNFKNSIEKAVNDRGSKSTLLFRRAVERAHNYYGDGFSPPAKSLILKMRVWFFDQFIFKKIRKQFGGKLKFFIGGGALLDLEMQQFFYAIGLPIYQGYGLTEAAPVISSNTPEQHKLGSSGKPVKNLEIRIVDEKGNNLAEGHTGEIIVKGENVMKGYWKNETATRETIKNSWLYTGDLGHLDSDGFLHVQGRFKSLLIGNDGEKYSPEGIEETIIDTSPFINQIMLYNNQKPYTTALIYPNKAALKNALVNASINPFGEEGILESLFIIKSEIDQFYEGGKHEGLFAARWLPSAIGILDEPFSVENKMINSTLKLVRSNVVARYQPLLDSLYTADGKKIDNLNNKDALKKLLRIEPEQIEEAQDEAEHEDE